MPSALAELEAPPVLSIQFAQWWPGHVVLAQMAPVGQAACRTPSCGAAGGHRLAGVGRNDDGDDVKLGTTPSPPPMPSTQKKNNTNIERKGAKLCVWRDSASGNGSSSCNIPCVRRCTSRHTEGVAGRMGCGALAKPGYHGTFVLQVEDVDGNVGGQWPRESDCVGGRGQRHTLNPLPQGCPTARHSGGRRGPEAMFHGAVWGRKGGASQLVGAAPPPPPHPNT
mmetsp:Transcript_107501/g.181811  ORF Transcript_107501/g.181811 Transcript_107501/m.181811 type:complete len:224 (+) Transcript_107501:364-1035(+)